MNNKVKAAIAVFCCLALCSCSVKYSSASFIAMDTYMELSANTSNDTLKLAENEISRLSSIYDSRNESELTRLNASGNANVSNELADIMKLSKQYAKSTNGAFNPALFNVISLWNIGSESFKVPNEKDIELAVKASDYNNIEINGNKITLKNNAKIDLGAVAKGYASEKAADILTQNGVSSAMLSLGGNIALIGKKNNSEDWKVAIQDPRGQTNEMLGVVKASDCFVVTSGDYQRYSEVGGKRYHHIFSENGYPSDSGLISVTIICDSGTKADIYSTALFVMGLDNALAFYKNDKSFEAIFVTQDKTVYVTDGIKEKFTLTNTEDYAYAD